jgi:hypothetical protein
MIEAFFGTSDMGAGILIDQLGSYMVLNTLGITIARHRCPDGWILSAGAINVAALATATEQMTCPIAPAEEPNAAQCRPERFRSARSPVRQRASGMKTPSFGQAGLSQPLFHSGNV